MNDNYDEMPTMMQMGYDDAVELIQNLNGAERISLLFEGENKKNKIINHTKQSISDIVNNIYDDELYMTGFNAGFMDYLQDRDLNFYEAIKRLSNIDDKQRLV